MREDESVEAACLEGEDSEVGDGGEKRLEEWERGPEVLWDVWAEELREGRGVKVSSS